MRAFTVYWNQLTDVTQIKYNQSFPDWSYMEKVDVLQDVIAELSEMQQAIMSRQSALDKLSRIAVQNGERL
jgi:chemotaxis protein CheY-P-specific phosphatase CheC